MGLSPLAGCSKDTEIKYAEPFQSALTQYRHNPSTEETCNKSAQTYIRLIPKENLQRDVTEIIEQEITCDRGYVKTFAGMSQFIVAQRELFPDGRVKVSWDPGNKYISTNPFPSGNYR